MFSTVQPPPHLQLLHSRGVDLVRAAIIGDDKREIVEEVLRLRDKVGPDGFVFTSGGIGPTHDDITSESIAAAFGVPWEKHPEAWALLEARYPPGAFNPARQRMATLHASAAPSCAI